MRNLRRNNQTIVTDQCFARSSDAGFTVLREWDVGGARVSAIEGPFGFAVADDESSGGCHCCDTALKRSKGWNGGMEVKMVERSRFGIGQLDRDGGVVGQQRQTRSKKTS